MAFSLVLGGSAGAAELPVVATRLVTGEESHVELRNTASLAATAWSLAITTHMEGRVQRVVHTRDTYMAEVTRQLPGASEERDWLLPGHTVEMNLEPVSPRASVEVVAVVLEDGTSMGDEEAIRAIFGRRVAEREALSRIVEAFQAALTANRGVAALRNLQERLGQTSQIVPTAHRAAAEAVETFLAHAAAVDEETIDQALRAYAAFVERQYHVAVRHTRGL